MARPTVRSCDLLFLFDWFIFYLQIFSEKKQKILFYNVSINLYIM